MASIEDAEKEVTIDQKANNLLLYLALSVNVVLFAIAIFQTTSYVSDVSLIPFTEVLVEYVKSGIFIIPTAGIITCLIILILNSLNVAIGKRVPLLASIIKIALKIPINLILLMFVLWFVWTAWTSYSMGTSYLTVVYGTLSTQVATIFALLFLVFFVKKV